MISYNDERIIRDCLESIRSQDYPQSKVSIVMVDGGSTDNTLKIAESYGVEVLRHPELKNAPQVRGAIVFNHPKTELVVTWCADNRFNEKDCLRRLVEPFADDEIVASETFRYAYRPSDPALSRYFALIGGTDPVAIDLGKADRAPYDADKWHSFGKVVDAGRYYKVEFAPDIMFIPTLGMNGFVLRRKCLEAIGDCGNESHTDVCVRLIRAEYNKFAFAKGVTVAHFIDTPLLSFLKRRLLWASVYSSANLKREYFVFTNDDWPRLLWIILTYPTVVFPLLRAIRGFARKPDVAWFLHPVLCFAFFVGYSYFFLKKTLVSIFSQSQ